MSRPATTDCATRRPVWDLFVRIFHWSLVSCVILNYSVVEEGEWLHQWLGYTASALVVARVVWGFVGSRHARFADFFPTPARLRKHWTELRLALRTGHLPRHVGHSPFGALMMLSLMALVLLLGLTGWLQTTDQFWGVEWLQETHEILANALMVTAAVHAMAALLIGRLERCNLIAAMISGVKVFK